LRSALPESEGVFVELMEKYEVFIFVGYFIHNGNKLLAISPESIQWLGRRSLGVAIDVYSA
jgi:hypothetical protein